MKYPICIVILLFSCFRVIAQNPLTDSLIAYYPFSGNANDASGNGNNGTVYGATLTADRFGNPNSAYQFNGISDFISYMSVSKFEPTTLPVSITFWFKPGTPSYGTLFSNNYTWGIYTGFSVDMEPTGGTIEANIFDGGPTNSPNRRSVGSSINLFDNKWHFAAAIIRGPLDMSIYIDCNYDTATVNSGSGGPLVYTGDTGISGRSFLLPAGYAYSLYYAGALDEVRFYHRALSTSDLWVIRGYPNPLSLPRDTSICSGDSVELNTSGAVNYSWSPAFGLSCTTCSSPFARPLTNTTYVVSSTYGSCVINDSVVLSVTTSPSVTSGPNANICQNASTQLSATGVGNYVWSPAAGLSNSTIANPVANPTVSTTYTVTASSSCGTAEDSTVIMVVPFPILSISTPDTFLCSGNSITISSNSSSNYMWSPATGLSCNTCPAPVASPLVNTTYYLASSNGNCSTKDSIEIEVNPSSVIHAGPDTSICFDSKTQLSASGNGNYIWSPATGLSNSTIANPVANPSVSTTYTVSSSNSCGTAKDSTEVIVMPPFSVSLLKQDTSMCPGGYFALSTGKYKSYEWTPSQGLNCVTCQSPVASPVASTTYTVTVTNTSGCTADTSIIVSLLPAPQIDLNSSIIIPCNEGVTLSPVITGGVTYHWLYSPTLPDTISLNPYVDPPQTTNYTIVATNGQCQTFATITAEVEGGFVSIPNAFSPNGDGINDTYKLIYNCGFRLDYFRIYNRWGEMVFQTNDLNGAWDGTWNGTLCPIGAYAYVVVGYKDGGEEIMLKGNVTLLR